MTKIECLLRPDRFEHVKEALTHYGIKGMTVTQVMGCGLQKGHTEIYRGTEYTISLLPKVKLEIVVKDSQVKEVTDLLAAAARTGQIGDGKIFLYPVTDAIRIRTGETGEAAI